MKAQHGKQYSTYIDQARNLFSEIEMVNINRMINIIK